MADLKPGDEILVEVRGKELIIKKKPSIADLLMEEAVAKVSVFEAKAKALQIKDRNVLKNSKNIIDKYYSLFIMAFAGSLLNE